MKLVVLKGFYCFVMTVIVRGQIWDTFVWSDADDFDDESGFKLWFDDIDYNDTSLRILQLSSTELQEEQELLTESSEIIIDELMMLVKEDLIELHTNYINEIISEHTINLFNVLHQIRKREHESDDIGKLRSFNDIFIWSNESESVINDLFGDNYFYEES